jgi:hypothetical protein
VAEHDPIVFAAGLSAKLAARSRHVCLLLGAGAARACGLPDVVGLQAHILSKLNADDKAHLEKQLTGRNLEQALSRLRRIAALLEGTDRIDDLSRDDARELDSRVCAEIVGALSLDDADLEPVLRLAAWAARSDYGWPLEIFTVNYDLLIETALERLRVTYFDGFIGALEGRFQTELVEAGPGQSSWLPAFFVRLWKLHGSVNWAWADAPRHEVVRLGRPAAGTAAAIYPSDTKYDESRRVPFVVLQDRLRRSLQQPETLMLISGYSFSDDHLNEMLFDAATHHPRSELIAFCHSAIPSGLAERAEATPNLLAVAASEAIIGGTRGDWTAPPNDPAPPEDVWTGGKLALPGFGALAHYLSRILPQESEVERRLTEILAAAKIGA